MTQAVNAAIIRRKFGNIQPRKRPRAT